MTSIPVDLPESPDSVLQLWLSENAAPSTTAATTRTDIEAASRCTDTVKAPTEPPVPWIPCCGSVTTLEQLQASLLYPRLWIYCEEGGSRWFRGKVVQCGQPGFHVDEVKVHYVGYNAGYDEWVPLAHGRLKVADGNPDVLAVGAPTSPSEFHPITMTASDGDVVTCTVCESRMKYTYIEPADPQLDREDGAWGTSFRLGIPHIELDDAQHPVPLPRATPPCPDCSKEGIIISTPSAPQKVQYQCTTPQCQSFNQQYAIRLEKRSEGWVTPPPESPLMQLAQVAMEHIEQPGPAVPPACSPPLKALQTRLHADVKQLELNTEITRQFHFAKMPVLEKVPILLDGDAVHASGPVLEVDDYMLKRCPNSASGFRGVHPSGQLWRAQLLSIQGQIKYVGSYNTPIQAARARRDFLIAHGVELHHNTAKNDTVADAKLGPLRPTTSPPHTIGALIGPALYPYTCISCGHCFAEELSYRCHIATCEEDSLARRMRAAACTAVATGQYLDQLIYDATLAALQTEFRYAGVDSHQGQWRARIRANRQWLISLGCFSTNVQAAQAYAAAAAVLLESKTSSWLGNDEPGLAAGQMDDNMRSLGKRSSDTELDAGTGQNGTPNTKRIKAGGTNTLVDCLPSTLF